MRSLLSVVGTLFCVYTASVVQAAAIPRVWSPTQVIINESLSPQKSGLVSFDAVARQIEVEIYNTHGKTPVLVESFRVPIQEQHQTCGSYVYTGSTITDTGLRVHIEFMDHTTRNCQDAAPGNPVTTVAVTFNDRQRTTTTYTLVYKP